MRLSGTPARGKRDRCGAKRSINKKKGEDVDDSTGTKRRRKKTEGADDPAGEAPRTVEEDLAELEELLGKLDVRATHIILEGGSASFRSL